MSGLFLAYSLILDEFLISCAWPRHEKILESCKVCYLLVDLAGLQTGSQKVCPICPHTSLSYAQTSERMQEGFWRSVFCSSVLLTLAGAGQGTVMNNQAECYSILYMCSGPDVVELEGCNYCAFLILLLQNVCSRRKIGICTSAYMYSWFSKKAIKDPFGP